jgi:hypothetical protein
MFKKLFSVNLSLFDEAAGAPTATTDAQGTQGSSHPASGDDKKPTVLYGKQDDNPAAVDDKTQTKVTSNTAEERTAAFEKLINGEYKDLFTERTQKMIDRRFAEAKKLETRINSLSPLLDMLSQCYNVTDEAKLLDAVMADNSWLEDLADSRGLTVPQLKEIMKIEAQNKQLMAQVNQENATFQAKQQYDKWQNEALQAKTTHGYDIDIDAEADANPKFVNLLRNGFDVKTAFEIVHMDDIMAGTVKRATQGVIENIKAKGMRPAENGANRTTGVVVKSDVTAFTKEDRRAIAERVRRGETIRL